MGAFFSVEQSYQLRGIAMIMIILSHLSQHLSIEYNIRIPLLIQGGSIGNSVFLFISGYGMYMSMVRQQSLKVRYLWQHIIKIIVPFIVVFLATLIGVSIMGEHHNWSDVVGYFFTMTFPHASVWFLKAIIMLYVFSFIAFKLSTRPYRRVALIAAFSLIYCVIGSQVGIGKWMYETILNFAAGMFVAIIEVKMNRINWKIALSFFLTLFLILFVVYLKIPIPFVNRLLYGLFFTLALIYAFKITGIRSEILRFVGINSILFYLFHIGFTHVHYSPCIDPILTITITIGLTLLYVRFKGYIDRLIMSIT